jgi:hypothetical protein
MMRKNRKEMSGKTLTKSVQKKDMLRACKSLYERQEAAKARKKHLKKALERR